MSSERSFQNDCAMVYRLYRFVIIVEKDAVFQRLAAEGFPEATSSILVTARGMPDFATRFFLQMLAEGCPHLVFVAGAALHIHTCPTPPHSVWEQGILLRLSIASCKFTRAGPSDLV